MLETQNSKQYRFVGQSMLSALAKKVCDGFNSMIIQNAQEKSLDFYRKTCGFSDEFSYNDEISFIVDKSQLQSFIEQTEQRTNL